MDDGIQLDANDFQETPDVEAVETQETTTPESSTDEKKAPEVADDGFDEPEEKSEESEKPESKEEATEEDAEASEESTEEESDKPKAKNAAENRIRSLANENRQLKEQLASQLQQQYRSQTADELVEQGYSPTDARVEALEQQVQLQNYERHVTELNTQLNNEAVQVMSEYPVFDEKSPEYDPKFVEKVGKLYESSQLQFDESGNYVTQAKTPLYDFYKEMAELRGESTVRGEVKAQKAKEKMLSSAEVPSSAKPVKSESEDDPFMKGFLSV